MRVVLQRVSEANVSIAGEVVGEVGEGLLLLVGFTDGDDEGTLRWMAEKVTGLRVFSDGEGKMNLSLDDVGGDVLAISQFTRYGDTRKGRRPSFVHAAPPDIAIPLYERFLELLAGATRGRIESGEFGAMMDVALVNAGPVTLVLER